MSPIKPVTFYLIIYIPADPKLKKKLSNKSKS